MFFLKKEYIYNIIFTSALIFCFLSSYNSTDYIPTSAISVSGKTILIDAGHGMPDGGAVGDDDTLEADLNLKYSKELGALLIKSGARVIYTREDEYSISTKKNDTIRNIKQDDMKLRKHIRDNSNADLFISIHMNKFSDSKYHGAQVFYNDTGDNKMLADCIQEQIKTIADSSNKRKIKNSKNDIYILNDCKMPSILIECGFLSNKTESALLKSDNYTKKFTFAVYSGILKYFST